MCTDCDMLAGANSTMVIWSYTERQAEEHGVSVAVRVTGSKARGI